jgi:hypothetical protein
MEANEKRTTEVSLIERLRQSWFAPVVALGALGIFVAAALRGRPEAGANPPSSKPAGAPPAEGEPAGFSAPAAGLPREYVQSAALGGPGSTHPFRLSLNGIAVGPGDLIYALGDNEVRIFESNGNPVRNWKVPEKSACFAVGPDRRVYVGMPGRVEIFDADGSHAGGFAAGADNKPADITAIKVFQKDILVADAAARIIRRYDANGKQLGIIGNKSKAGSFILPNKSLDIDIDAKGVIRATDTGRHQVTSWAIDGSPLGSFGKFGMSDPVDFVGCCNPVNLALAPDGTIVTGEKMVARIKVYQADGKLLAVIGPEHFDPNCIHIHIAVDSKGRILAADPERREVKIFSLVAKAGAAEPKTEEPVNK